MLVFGYLGALVEDRVKKAGAALSEVLGFEFDPFAAHQPSPANGGLRLGKPIKSRVNRTSTESRRSASTVTAFYVSNVKDYLRTDGTLPAFCANVAALPMNSSSVILQTGNVGSLPDDDPSAFDRPPGQPLRPSATTPMIGLYVTGVVMPLASGCER